MKGFTGKDFCEMGGTNEERAACTHGVGNNWCSGTYNADRANALLPALLEAEINRRLSDARSISLEDITPNEAPPVFIEADTCKQATHKAKLLCITPIAEPWPWEKKE